MIKKDIVADLDSVYNYYDGDVVLGYIEVRNIDGIVDIINVYTSPEYRRKGIASSLFKYLFENEDYSRIMLEVNENNLEAIRLYSKLGFNEISVRERYYGSDTAIIMEKVK